MIEVHAEMPRSKRLINLLMSISPSRELWRERSKKNPYYFRETSNALRSAISRATGGRYDVILLFEALFSPGINQTRLAPYVIYEDSTSTMAIAHWPRWVPDSARSAAYRELELNYYRGASKILTTNEAARQSLILDYQVSAENVINVGQGHDFGDVCDRTRVEDARSILFVGYEFERKGGNVLLEAFRLVRRSVPLAKLLVVGPEISLDEPGVTVLGRIKDKARLRALYETAGIFVLPSIFDPMPHAVMEAMSAAVPVVISSGCGTVELIDDNVNGFVVPASDAGILAERLTCLLKDRDLRCKLGRAGAETVRARCRWQDKAKRVADILEQVAYGVRGGNS